MLHKFKTSQLFFKLTLFCFFVLVFLLSCSKRREQKEEQISLSSSEPNTVQDSMISIQGNVPFNQIQTTPLSIVLTGMPEHRLVTVYRLRKDGTPAGGSIRSSSRSYDEDSEEAYHFMPGIDLIYGYHLLNVAHYDLKMEKMNYLFDHPVLIKSLYYPSFEQDSLDKKPVNRDYYLISVYDEDSNNDTLINRKDLRRFYHFNAGGNVKTKVIPSDYSVVRSQYDPKNDVMYIFARQDVNKNGAIEVKEPMHVFWINLKAPAEAKRLY